MPYKMFIKNAVVINIATQNKGDFMPVKGAKTCGAKCRTKGGAPCLAPAMANGRCRMHNGTASRRAKHGRRTNKAILQRKKEMSFLKEIKILNQALMEQLKGQKSETKTKFA